MYGYIYKTTNIVNGKFYVGQHKYELPQIDPSYLGSGKILSKAIQKYGVDSFKCELIECCESQEDLNTREKFWIEYFRALNEDDCYNIAAGGDGGNTIKYFSEDEKRLIYKKREDTWAKTNFRQRCSERMSQYYKQDPQNKIDLSNKLKEYYNNNPAKRKECAERQRGKLQSEKTKEKHRQSAKRGAEHQGSRSCICIETQQIFDTIKSTQVLANHKDVHKCCKGLCETAGGYHWAYTNDTERINKYASYVGASPNPLRKQILCVESGEIFSSAVQAAQKVGCNNVTILNACKSGKISFGYHWSFVINLD